MKKFCKNIFVGMTYLWWTLLVTVNLILMLGFVLAGIISIPFLVINIVLASCNVWYAPWWLYILELLTSCAFIILFIDSIKSAKQLDRQLEELHEINCPYYIEGKDE